MLEKIREVTIVFFCGDNFLLRSPFGEDKGVGNDLGCRICANPESLSADFSTSVKEDKNAALSISAATNLQAYTYVP